MRGEIELLLKEFKVIEIYMDLFSKNQLSFNNVKYMDVAPDLIKFFIQYEFLSETQIYSIFGLFR